MPARLSKELPKSALGWLAIVITFLAAACSVTYLAFGPPIWKTSLGRHVLPGGGELLIGQDHDGDISHRLWVKVSGEKSRHPQWEEIGWSIEAAEECRFIQTSDGRYSCFTSNSKVTRRLHGSTQQLEAPILIIYDRESGVVWPTKEAYTLPNKTWHDGWQALKKVDPSLPEWIL